MKKIYFLTLLSLILGFGLRTNAQNQVKFEWNNPGSVIIVEDNVDGEPLSIGSDATSYDLSYSPESIYIYPAPGYKITKIMLTGDTKSRSVGKDAKYGQRVGLFIGSSANGKTFTIETKEVGGDAVVPVNVINGSKFITGTLTESWKDEDGVSFEYQKELALEDGKNELKYDSASTLDMLLNVRKGMIESIYSVKRNGETVTKDPGYYEYTIRLNDLKPTDTVDIQVYDGEAPVVENCIVTLKFAEGMDGAVKNVYDRKRSIFPDVVDGKFEVYKDSEVQLNFDPDYNISKIMLGEQDITKDLVISTFDSSIRYVRFVAKEDVTVTIEGTAVVYGDVEFTAYVMNPEGVLVMKEIYGSLANQLYPEDGTPITEDIQLPDNTFTDKVGNITTYPGALMTPENTRMYKIKVSEKTPRMYFRPFIGYYISAVWNKSMNEPQNYGDYLQSSTLYIVAKKMERNCFANVEVIGDKAVRFNHATGISNLWGNESHSFALTKGEQKITFCPEFHNPFDLVGPGEYANEENINKFQVYVDGMEQSPDDNFVYHLNLYSEIAPEGEEQKGSDVKIYADGKGTMKKGGVKLDLRDEKTLDCYYGEVNRKLVQTNASFLAATPVVIKQPKGGTLVKFDDGLNEEVIFGYENGEFVNKFTDGEYKFDVKSMKQYNFRAEADPAWTGSGVEEIGIVTGAGSGEIYNLQGISVGKEFELLPAGIYIRDGKKIVKK